MIPSLFVSHGSPMMAVESSATHRFLQTLSAQFERPKAIVCASAHWETTEPAVTAAAHPQTIHDFYGFPEQLYSLRYPAPGAPTLAQRAAQMLHEAGFTPTLDPERGLDHGAWVPLKLMYPDAAIPVIQLSVQTHRDPAHHLALGQALRPLRAEGILIMGSGSTTHNLRELRWQERDAAPVDYALAFTQWLKNAIVHNQRATLLAFQNQAPLARRNHPTPEHFLPLFVALGAAATDDTPGQVLHDVFNYGALSMTAFAWD